LNNIKDDGKIKSKYEDNIDECKKLSQYINENKRFILCFGQNKDGELGTTSKEQIREPRALQCTEELTSAQSISSGSRHSALVTKSGEIFVCGSSLHGKLGISDLGVPNLSKFSKISSLTATIKQIACGDYHTLALSKDGLVFAWGGSLYKKAQGSNEP
jgi:alpha-tubulin suppressor-like RCC1 family protein